MSNFPSRTPSIAALLADVDGTLITSEKVLTQQTIDAVRRLHQSGIAFFITSGRPPRGMCMLIEPLGVTKAMAAFNGGMIVRPDLSVVDMRLLPDDVVNPVVDALLSSGLDVFIYRGMDWYVRSVDAPHVDHEASNVQFQPTVASSLRDVSNQVVKIVGVSDDLDLVARCEADLQKRFAEHVCAERSQPYYLDVTHPEANKGTVIERLAHLLNLPTERIAAIGDQENDVLMFKRSGLSIAMGNASKEVQKQADCVTTSNEDEGFANAVARFILPKAA
jgi:Cof subfamily protein (haloacid dehalogenase superfamily)